MKSTNYFIGSVVTKVLLIEDKVFFWEIWKFKKYLTSPILKFASTMAAPRFPNHICLSASFPNHICLSASQT